MNNSHTLIRLAFLLGVVLLAFGRGVSAQTVYAEDFESQDTLATLGFTVYDVSGDGLPNDVPSAWENNDGSLLSPQNASWYPVIFWDQDENLDDWMITPGFPLTSGVSYDVEFTLECDESIGSFGSDVQVYIGTAATATPTVGDMTAGALLLDETDLLTDGSALPGQRFTVSFSAPTTDTYYLAFRDWSAPADSSFYTVVDDIEVTGLPATGSVLSPDPLDATGRRGQENFYPFTLENIGSTTDDFTFGVTGGTWTTALYETDGTTPLSGTPVTLANGETFEFYVGVTIPDTDTGMTENFTVEATGTLSNTSAALNVEAVIFFEDFLLGEDRDPITLPQFGFSVEDFSGTGTPGSGDPTWFLAANTPFDSGASMLVRWSETAANDDWSITPAIYLESGVTYNLTFDAWMPGFGGLFQDLEVTIGTGNTSADQTTQILDLTDAEIDPWGPVITQFTAPSTGDFYLGFHDFTDADVNITMIGNIRVEEAPAVAVTLTGLDADTDAQRGTPISYRFEVENLGSNTTDFNATVSGNTWTTTLYESDGTTPLADPFTMTPLSVREIVATVDVAPMATPGTTDTFMVTVEDVGTTVSESASNTTTAVEYNWGGPLGGYYFANSLAGASGAVNFPTPDWIDISGSGTNLNPLFSDLDDSVVGPINLGHSFEFFGASVTQFWISTNGWISFSAPADSDFSNDEIPTATGVNHLVTGLWDDYDFETDEVTGAQAYYQTDGSRTVISWVGVGRFDADPGEWATFQIVLSPNGDIQINIQEYGSAYLAEASATVGVENSDGSDGLQYHFNGTLGTIGDLPLSIRIGTNDPGTEIEMSAGVMIR